ncbi:MAG: hypothetical protein KA186_00050 [Flavobacteriales bacterium]|nr:hypothetical protein [Flavobacteriales bacterium]
MFGSTNSWGPLIGTFSAERQATKWERALAWAGILFVAVFAIVYAKERLYADSAYFLTQVVDDGNFHIINGRWLIPLSQWIALIGVHLGLPIGTIIILFSLGNVFLLVALFLFVIRVLGNPTAGLTLVAMQFVGITHALFCPIFEFYYGAMLLVVFFALLYSAGLTLLVRLTLISVTFVLVVSSHFMGMLVMLLALALVRIWKYPKLSILLTVLLIVQLSHRLYFLSYYESHAFENIGIRMDLWGVFWVFAPGRLLGQFLQGIWHYPDTMLLAFLATVMMIRNKDGWGLFVYSSGLLAMYVLISLFFPDATHDRYREILDYTPTAWTVLVIGLRVMGIANARDLVLVVLAISLCFRIGWSTYVARTYTERVEWMEERIAFARGKGIRRSVDLERRTFQPPGRIVAPLAKLNPPEVLILSACQGPDSVVTIVPLTSDDLIPGYSAWLDEQLKQFGTEFPTSANGKYFHMSKEEFQVLQ